MKPDQLLTTFNEIFGNSDNQVIHHFFSPGRVNLIGEHTDYNGGLVLPCGLNFGTQLLIRKSDKALFKFHSLNFPEGYAEIKTDAIKPLKKGHWANFPLGIISQFLDRGKKAGGLELLYFGDIPNGAGLSSSASIEVVTAYALNEIYQWGYDLLELALLSQKCEHEFIGTQCGIMDQFAVTFAKRDHALFLNCNTMKYTLIPFELGDYNLVITNTNKRRDLNDSKYNERVLECNTALQSIGKYYELNSLGVLNLESFRELEHYIQHPVRKKRVFHVVNENYRVLDSVKALEHGNLEKFGKLMYASHSSLKDYYEVTGIELDTLVNEARKIEGVIGSRMTGAGFGGCTISLVEKSKTNNFINTLGEVYKAKTGLDASFYVAETGDGVREVGN